MRIHVILLALSLVFFAGALTPQHILDPTVSLSHCATFGTFGDFLLEWQLSLEPKNILEMRFTVETQRGFSAFGLTHGDRTQLLTGYPSENLACARALWDNDSPYDVYGHVYKNFPEVPGKLVTVNDTHVTHYIMRNISTTGRQMLQNGNTLPTNITIMWSYMMESLFEGACYGETLRDYTEWATFELLMSDANYLRTASGCPKFDRGVTPHRGTQALDPTGKGQMMLDGEIHQNKRVTALLFGGGLLLDSGRNPPVFSGSVFGGETAGTGMCQSTLQSIIARWSGFEDHVGGIQKYLISAGTFELPSLYFDRVNVGTHTFVQLSLGTPLLKNSSLYITIRAVNFAGLITAAHSKIIHVLNEGSPMFGTIQDGLVSQVNFQKSLTTLDAKWWGWRTEEHSSKAYDTVAITDNGFEYAVGLDGQVETGVIGWTTVPAFNTELSLTGLSLSHGQKYHISVRSLNCAGVYTKQVTSGVTVDVATPLPGFVRVGNTTGVHKAKVWLAEHLTASWSHFIDLVSGIASYEWAMGTSAVCPDPVGNTGMLMEWNNVGLVTNARNETLHRISGSLTVGTNIYVYIKAIDQVGNQVVVASNATQIVG